MHDAIEVTGDWEAIVDERLSRDLEALRTLAADRLPSLYETEGRLHERVRRRGVVRRRVIVAGSLAAACSTALAAPLFLAAPEPDSDAVRGRALVAGDAPLPIDERRAAAETMQEARAKRDALRREIVRRTSANAGLAENAAGATGAETATASRASSHATANKERREEQPRPTDLKNKLGPGREQLGKFLNQEFSPLLAECVEQAAARSPKLTGMFAIGIETLAYEELGAVVDSAEPTDRNQIIDPQFLECIRESAFTLIIPPPLTSGQEKFELNGHFGPPPADEEDATEP